MSDLRTMVMGTHASSLPERTLREEPYTYVCQGEGPYTVLGLLESLKFGKPGVKEIPGLWYNDRGFGRSTPPWAISRTWIANSLGRHGSCSIWANTGRTIGTASVIYQAVTAMRPYRPVSAVPTGVP